MLRTISVIAVAVCLSPSWLYAQGVHFTVNATSAAVYKAPTTASPVIGNAPRGTIVEVTRELGSWVRIPWPSGTDGAAYLHVSMGSISRLPNPGAAGRPAVLTSAGSATQSSMPAVTTMSHEAGATVQAAPLRTIYVEPPTHLFGLGGHLGVSSGFGVTARAWSRNRFGVQFEISRDALSERAVLGRLTSVRFGPSVLYSLRDHVSDYVSLRPYVGAGATIQRHRLTGLIPDESSSENSFGLQTFGGGEVTFASLPRFGLSADLGYRWSESPFPGFDVDGLRVAVSGIWYVR